MTSQGQRGRYAIIPTHNRHEEVAELVAEMTTQVGLVIVIDNASEPPLGQAALIDARSKRFAQILEHRPIHPVGHIWLWHDAEQPPNLARMWNAGLSAIASHVAGRHDAWDVAILNDDAKVPPGWFALVTEQMRAHGAAAACTIPARQVMLKTEPDRDIHHRMYGPAFVIRGELAAKDGDPLRAEERLPWWFQDTDMDWRARAQGGMLIVPGPYVPNTHGNSSTVGPLAEQAGRDRETFREIWGFAPW